MNRHPSSSGPAAWPAPRTPPTRRVRFRACSARTSSRAWRFSRHACLDGLEGFSHLIVLFHFHLVAEGERSLVTKPYLYDREMGAFACCSPRRPSGLGLDIVRLVRREGNVLVVAGGDMSDGTPILDIRPYIPVYHSFPDAELGWVRGRIPE